MLDVRAWNSIYELPAGPLSLALGAGGAPVAANRNLLARRRCGPHRWRFESGFDERKPGRVGGIRRGECSAVSQLRGDRGASLRSLQRRECHDQSQVSLRWQPDRTLLFRASAGSGFRAPSLEALYAPRVVSSAIPSKGDPARCPVTNGTRDCNGPFPTQSGGRPLGSETSSQWGVGTVWTPVPSLSLGIDYFDVIVHDLIQPVTADTVLALCPDGSMARPATSSGAAHRSLLIRRFPDPSRSSLPAS
jgi:hypothetical protein